MKLLTLLSATTVFLSSPSHAFFEQFFSQNQQQRQQQSHEDIYLEKDCGSYLCPDTLACVATPIDCPCPFPNSQQKCVFPPNPVTGSEASFICISKGERDCKWALDAYNGLV